MTDKGENTTRRPVQHVKQKPIVIKDECECSVSIVLNVVDERGQVDSDGAMEKLMKQAKRRKLKESKYIPKEVFLGKPYQKIEWSDAPLTKKCSCPTDPCDCQPHLLKSGNLPKSNPLLFLPIPKSLLRNWIYKPSSTVKPAGTLIPRLAEAVKAEIAVCKQMQESEELDAKPPEFCSSTCISFLEPTADGGNYANKKLLLEKYLKDNVEAVKQVPEPCKFQEEVEIKQENFESDDQLFKNHEQKCPDAGNDIELNNDKFKQLETDDNCEKTEDDPTGYTSNRQDLRLLKLNDQEICNDGNPPTNEEGLKNQVIKVRRSRCPCAVYEIEKFTGTRSTEGVSKTNKSLEKRYISFIIKRWLCESDKCECSKRIRIKATIFESVDADIKLDKEKELTHTSEINKLTREQREIDEGKTNIFGKSSKQTKTIDKCYEGGKDFAKASTISIKGSSQSKVIKKIKWSEINTISSDEDVYAIDKQETDGPPNDNKEGTNVDVAKCSFSLDSDEINANSDFQDAKYLEGKNKNITFSECIDELKEEKNNEERNFNASSGSDIPTSVDEQSKNKTEDTKVIPKTDSNDQTATNAEERTAILKEEPTTENVERVSTEDNFKGEQANYHNESNQLLEGESRPEDEFINENDQCEFTMKEFLTKLKELITLIGQRSFKKGPIGRWEHSMI